MTKQSDPKMNMGTVCLVCGTFIANNNDCFAMSTRDGHPGWRHKKCGPGSKAWKLKFPDGGNAQIREMLEKKRTPKKAGGQGECVLSAEDTARKAIKEFLGREKYLRYMDTVNKNTILWSIIMDINGHVISQNRLSAPLDPEVLYGQVSTPI